MKVTKIPARKPKKKLVEIYSDNGISGTIVERPEFQRMLGYRLENGKLEIVPDEAEIVREIFRLYLSGMGRQRITKEMAKKYPAIGAIKNWSQNGIDTIIRNEKYKGNLLLQKTYRPNHRGKKDKPVNNHQVRQYYVTGSHEAIIALAIFDAV